MFTTLSRENHPIVAAWEADQADSLRARIIEALDGGQIKFTMACPFGVATGHGVDMGDSTLTVSLLISVLPGSLDCPGAVKAVEDLVQILDK